MNYFAIPGLIHRVRIPSITRREAIIKAVCHQYDVSFSSLIQKSRKRAVVEPRQVIMYLLKMQTNLSLKEISGVFNKDHATAVHASKVIQNMIDTDLRFCAKIDTIKEKIFGIYNDELKSRS